MPKNHGAYSSLNDHVSLEESSSETSFESRTSKWRKVSTYLRLVIESIIAILLVLILWVLVNDERYSHSYNADTDSRVSSGPFNQRHQYGRDTKYFSFSHKDDHLWQDFANENFGEIEFPPYDSTGFAIDRLNDHGSIAMLHSLHCLAGIRHAVQRLSEGEVTLAVLQDDPHVPHCFDYLRQSILCYADDTFERPRRENGILEGEVIEGAYDIRMCRDSTRLFEIGNRYGVWIDRRA